MFRSRAPAPSSLALPDDAREVRRRVVILPLRHRQPDSGKARRSWVLHLELGGGRCLRGALGTESKRPAPIPRRPSAPRSSCPPRDRAPSRPSAGAPSPRAALTRGRGVPAAGEAEKQRPQPAEPSRPLHAAPSLGARRAAAASRVSASLAPAPTSRLRRPGGWRPAQTGTAPRPPAAGNPSRRGGAQFPGSAALHLASPPPCPPDSCRGPNRTSSSKSRPGSNVCGFPARPALPLGAHLLGLRGAKGCTPPCTRAGPATGESLGVGVWASNSWPLNPCFLNCDSRVSNPRPTSRGEFGRPQRRFGREVL